MRTRLLLAVTVVSLAFPQLASAQSGGELDLVLSPAQARATLTPEQARGALVGPFGLENRLGVDADVIVAPALLGQLRDGGIIALDDPEQLKEARRFLRGGDRKPTLLRDGQRVDFRTRIRRLTRDRSLYGTLTFTVVPRGETPGRVKTAYRLGARIFIDPVRARYTFAAQAPGVLRDTDQTPGAMLLRWPIENTGNAAPDLRGKAELRDPATGRVLAASTLQPVPILPGSLIDLRTRDDKPLRLTAPYPSSVRLVTRTRRSGSKKWITRSALIRLDRQGRPLIQDADLSPTLTVTQEGRTLTACGSWTSTGGLPFAPNLDTALAETGSRRTLSERQIPLEARDSGEATYCAEFSGGDLRPGVEYTLTVTMAETGDEATSSIIFRDPGNETFGWLTENLGIIIAIIAVLLAGFAGYALAGRRAVREQGRDDA